MKLAVKKLNGLRIPLGVYEFGEEKLKAIEAVNPAFVRFKTEYTRKSASPTLLSALIEAVKALGAEPLLFANDLHAEASSYAEGETLMLEEAKPAQEEEPEEVAEEVAE